jgi:hypothetical protein
VVFDLEAKQCVSMSFDPINMSCHCCGSFLGRKGDEFGRQTFVLADQNFPASLPSDNGGLKCMKILRIEGGKLDELACLFLDITRGWLLPPGSLILLGSLSHLAETGLAAYTEDLCNAVAKLSNGFRRSVGIAPAPFVLSADIADPSLIRAIVELYAWINACMKGVAGLSPSAFQASMEGLNYTGSGLAKPDYPLRYRLPTSITGDKKQIWLSSKLASLPSAVKHYSIEIEVEIIGRLLADLDGFLALDLQLNPFYERDVIKEDMEPPDRTTYILIGGSHALRTANALARSGKKAIAATIAGWKPTADQMSPMLAKIKRAMDMCPDKEKVVGVIQAYDNCSYFAQDEEGNLTAAKKGSDGIHHIPGNSVLAHPDTQYMAFKKSLLALEAIKDIRKVILAPLPRYWEEPCCRNKHHVTNLKESDYKSKMEAGIYAYKTACAQIAFGMGSGMCVSSGAGMSSRRRAGYGPTRSI